MPTISREQSRTNHLNYYQSVARAHHPLRPLYSEFHRELYDREQPSTSTLDAIQLALKNLPALVELRHALDEKPAFTSILRYSPDSIGIIGQDGCFSSAMSMGAQVAFARLYRDLPSDTIEIIRTDDEVELVINHPSQLIAEKGQNKDKVTLRTSDEPTILFRSNQFRDMVKNYKTDVWSRDGYNRDEQTQDGMIIAHGETIMDAMPDGDLLTNDFSNVYIDLYHESETR